MPFYPIRNDITRMQVDAIVNAANRSLLGGGGVDGAIHRAAGPELLEECRTLGGCSTGDAKITRGYALPAEYIIHAVGPVYRDGMHGEETLLRSCYRRSLEIAEAHGLESVAFPLISAGAYGYPRAEAIRIASEEIGSFLQSRDMTVYLVFYDKDSFTIGLSRFPGLESRIEDSQVFYNPRRRRRLEEEAAGRAGYSLAAPLLKEESAYSDAGLVPSFEMAEKRSEERAIPAPKENKLPGSLEDALRNRDESFSEMLLRCITASGMSDPDCYRKANIDKKLFSKIRSKPGYKPTKQTAVAFAIALKLDREQTDLLLRRAGLALNKRDTFDIIVDYFISKRFYDLFEINNVLFQYDQPLLGCNQK